MISFNTILESEEENGEAEDEKDACAYGEEVWAAETWKGLLGEKTTGRIISEQLQ